MDAMQNWLARDSHCPSLLMQLLDWKDKAALHSSNRAWRTYINNTSLPLASLASSSDHQLSVALRNETHRMQFQRAGAWLYPQVHQLHLNLIPPIMAVKLKAALQVLHRFSQLQQLHLFIPLKTISNSFLELLTSSLPKLQELQVIDNGREINQNAIQTLSFAPLRHLSHLTSFALSGKFYCSKSQVDDLLQCTKLERLRCGRWAGSHYPFQDGNRTRPRWIEESISRLHELPVLRSLYLADELIEPDAWRHLSKCRSIQSLAPRAWSHHINEEWRLLANLSNLTQFKFSLAQSFGNSHFPPPLAAAFHECQSITDLSIGSCRFDSGALLQICLSLPSLQKLELIHVLLDSAAPLIEAKSLTKLTLNSCVPLDAVSGAAASAAAQEENCRVFWPNALPVLPQLLVFEASREWTSEEPPIAYQEAIRTKLPHASSIRILDLHARCLGQSLL